MFRKFGKKRIIVYNRYSTTQKEEFTTSSNFKVHGFVLTGKMDSEERKDILDKFNTDPE